jgi:hypothetical protein
MQSRTLPIAMAPLAAYTSLAPTRKVVVTGSRAGGLTTYIAARAVCEGKPVRVICGDNRFDPYAVARFARSKGMKPEDALRSILIARAFTAYQLQELVSRLDQTACNGPVVITGPCSTFFDDDLPFVDAAQLFYRMLWRIVELASNGLTLVLVQRELSKSLRRVYFLRDLCGAADVVLNCEGMHTFRLEHRSRIVLPRLAWLEAMIGD